MSRSYRLYCSVYGCLNSSLSKPDLTFFKLPGHSARFSEWLRLMCREDLANKCNTCYRICEEHFKVQDILLSTCRKVLKKNSLPSLNLPDLQTLQSTVRERSRKKDKRTQTDNTEDSQQSENEIKVFCPKCDTEVSHTADGIQEDQTKILIAKVYHYFEQEYEELKTIYGDLDLTPLSKFRQRTALATGVSETKILEILKEEEGRNADKRQGQSGKPRGARKRSRQTDSSSEEDSSDDNVDDNEESSHVNEAQMVIVKEEPTEYYNFSEEPLIYVSAAVKEEPSDIEVKKEQTHTDPISTDVKTEPTDVEDITNETLALNDPTGTKRKGRKVPRSDVTSTRQHTQGESSTAAASSSGRLAEQLDESSLFGDIDMKAEEIEIHEEGVS